MKSHPLIIPQRMAFLMRFARISFSICISDGGVECIQYFFLVSAPERRNQERFWAIPGEAVDDHFLGKKLQTGDDNSAVLLKSQDMEGFFLIFPRKLRATKHVKKLELDAVRADAF